MNKNCCIVRYMSRINFSVKNNKKYIKYIKKMRHSSYVLSHANINNAEPILSTVITTPIMKKEQFQDRSSELTIQDMIFKKGNLLHR